MTRKSFSQEQKHDIPGGSGKIGMVGSGGFQDVGSGVGYECHASHGEG